MYNQGQFRVNMMTKLSVNLNKIALLRNARDLNIPNVLDAARAVIKAGAYGVTIHPRPDERHIRYNDVFELHDLLRHEYRATEFNIEGNPFTGKYMELMPQIEPDQATLVPDAPGANTSDHGWSLAENKKRLVPIIKELKGLGIRVSLFMDADSKEIPLAKEFGADRIELYTEPYARAFRTNHNLEESVKLYASAAQTAIKCGLGVNAGHDLSLDNLAKFCASVPGVMEVSIGHALIAEAIYTGLENTVKEYLKILSKT